MGALGRSWMKFVCPGSISPVLLHAWKFQGKICGLGGQIAVNWKIGSFKCSAYFSYFVISFLRLVWPVWQNSNFWMDWTLLGWSTDYVASGANVQFQRSAHLKWQCQFPTFTTVTTGNCGPRFSRHCHHHCWGGGATGFFFSVFGGWWQLPWSIFMVPWCSTNRTFRSCTCCSALWACDVPQDPTKRKQLKQHLPILRCHVGCRMSLHGRLLVLPAEVAGRIQGGEVPVQHWKCAGAPRNCVWCVEEKVGRGGPNLHLSTLHLSINLGKKG